jgi:4-amino-4-deoxy-L-arabinose transferase-like glycosyltransferase
MTGEGRYRLILIALCLVLFSFNLGGRDLWDPDEPRYAGIARGILESGDWLNLSDNGRPYTDKPPLYFWILALSARMGSGVTALNSRIPGSLLALLGVLLAYRLGKDLFTARAGLFGALVLSTSQRFFLEARWVHIDMLLAVLILVAMDSAYRALERREAWRWGVVYLAATAGCLAKGPVALAVPAAALLTFLASTREISRLQESRWWVGLPAALLPTLIWLAASSRSSGFDPLGVVRTQVFRRFQEGVHHPRPFYYYLYSLPLEFLPWTPFLAGTVAATFPLADRAKRRQLLFLYGWVVGGAALFTLAAEKRPSYLLPIFPPLALLTGRFLDEYLVRWSERDLRKWMAGPLWAYAAACFVGILWIPRITRPYPGLGGRLALLATLYLFVCAGALTLFRQGRRGGGLVLLLGGIGAGYLVIAGSLLPWFNEYKSARPFCERVVARIRSSPLALYGDYLPAYAFYTHRRLEILRSEEALKRFLAARPGACTLISEEDYEALHARLPLVELDREAVGHRTYLLASGGQESSGASPPR